MPQGDFQSFSSTVFALGLFFVGGYFVFVSFWAPKILLLLKSRAWLSKFQAGTTTSANKSASAADKFAPHDFFATAATAGLTVQSAGSDWSEPFLIFVQFAGLTLLLSLASLGTTSVSLPVPDQTGSVVSGSPVDQLVVSTAITLQGWVNHREEIFSRGAVNLVGDLVGQSVSALHKELPKLDANQVFRQLRGSVAHLD